MNVPYSYLDRQFAELNPYLEDIRKVVLSGDFTLGPAVEQFEDSSRSSPGRRTRLASE